MYKILIMLSLLIPNYSLGNLNERKEMQDAAIKVLDIVITNSDAYKNASNRIELYYENSIPDYLKDVLVVVGPVAKILNDREIVIYKKEFQ